MMKSILIVSLLIIIAVWQGRGQRCTVMEEIQQLRCQELGQVRSDFAESQCRSFITFQSSQYTFSENTQHCQNFIGEDLNGTILIQCFNDDDDDTYCTKSEVEFECSLCTDEKEGRDLCNCDCSAKCKIEAEDNELIIKSIVNATRIVSTEINTTGTSPTHEITSPDSQTTDRITDSTDFPTSDPEQRTNSSNSASRNNISPTPNRPLNSKQFLVYVLPICGVLIILLIAVIISIIVCLSCRRVLKKDKDSESDTQTIELNSLYTNPHVSSTNEPNYSTISEIIPNSCNSNRNDSNKDTSNFVSSNRLSENVYQEIRSSLISEASQATSPDEMIQNVLYNLGATNETNNFYHVLVAGEVVEPSIYDKIVEVNPLYSKDNTSNEQREFHTYIEPPKNFPELKHMLDAYIHEIRAEDIEMGEEFASGQFGVVYRGKYRTGKGDIPVAIKTLKGTVHMGTDSRDNKIAFMREAAILTQFHHPYVLRLIGILTTQEPWMMVTELLKTELRQLLLQIRPAAQFVSSSPSSPSSDKLRIQNLLLKFSQEIAAGMEHLAEKKFIHRDLAARNVLVAKDLSVRVADFGMSRGIDCENDYYTSSGGGRVPLRWTAPEALFYNKFSEKSDVWSFGMTLYEIWSLGDKPWEGRKNEEVIQALTNGDTISQPVHCPAQMYQIMLETWKQDKDNRPTFSQLKRELNLIN